MKHWKIAILTAGALALGACNRTFVIPNPFGGAPLVLTGNLANDLPGIKAFAADIKAGAKADAVAVRETFQQYCPAVDESATVAGTVTPGQVVDATGGLITVTAASQKINQSQQAIGIAQRICAGGTSADIKSAFVNFAAAATEVYGWIKGR